MRMFGLHPSLCSALPLALLVACGSDAGTQSTPSDSGGELSDAVGDAAVDSGEDVALDTAGDAPEDSSEDTPTDTALDAPADAAADATVDGSPDDVPGDAPVDVPGDAAEDATSDTAADTVSDAATDTPVDAGGDASDDTAADVAPDVPDSLRCEPDTASTSFGVSLTIDLERCEFTLAELRAGVTLEYEIEIRPSLTEVYSRPLDAGHCMRPGDSGLNTLERVFGGDESWCVCDEGLCMGSEPEFARLPSGNYTESITWDGRNWFGPSDFGNPPGDPFPPGDYRFSVQAAGQYMSAEGRTLEWDITAAVPIRVVE